MFHERNKNISSEFHLEVNKSRAEKETQNAGSPDNGQTKKQKDEHKPVAGQPKRFQQKMIVKRSFSE